MTAFNNDSLDRGLMGSYQPLTRPYMNSGTVGTTSILACPDHPGNLQYNLRRVRIFNSHSSQILSLCLVDLGSDVTAGNNVVCIQIPPLQIYAQLIDAQERLLLIANAAGTGWNIMVSDI